MANNPDFQGFNALLTDYVVEKGRGGAFVADDLAPPTLTENQEFVVPVFASALAKQGFTNTLVGPDGDVNIRENIIPDFVPGKCVRRGLKAYVQDEVKAQPHGEMFGSEQAELDDLIDELRREMEEKVKALLDTRKSASGYHASPSVKWDAAGFTNVKMIENIEEAILAAELTSNRSGESGKWKLVIPPLVAQVAKAYLRQVLKYTDGQFSLGGKLPDVLADVPVILPGAMHNTTAAGQTASIARIWNTDDVYLVYVDPSFSTNKRTYTAMAQMRWSAMSASYAAYQWRQENPMIKRNWVGTDIYDSLQLLSADGIYVLDDVLT